MYYDAEGGFKSRLGLFSKLTVTVLALSVVGAGIYAGISYLAPEISAVGRADKSALEYKVETEEVSGEFDFLRIPSIGLERQVVDKNAEGKIQITRQGDSIILSGRARTLGITPMETVILSPLALLGSMCEGQKIYLNLERQRTVYEVELVEFDQKPIGAGGNDLTIYALNGDNSRAVTVVRAKKLMVVK